MPTGDSREKILEATQNVLVETGFSNLSFSKIADEADISKSLISYHFNSKQDLVAELLEWMTEIAITDRVEQKSEEDDLDYLIRILLPEDEFKRKIQRSIFELGTISSQNEEIAEILKELNRNLKEELEEAIPGENSEIKSEMALSLVDGVVFRRELLEEDFEVSCIRQELKSYLQ